MAKKIPKQKKLRQVTVARQRQAVRSWLAQQKHKQELERQRKLGKERLLHLQQLEPCSQVRDPEPSSAAAVNKVLIGVAASMGVVFRRRYRPAEAWDAIHVASGTTITAGTKRRAWKGLLAELQNNGIDLKLLPEWEIEHGGGGITARRPEGATARSLRRHKTVVGRAGYRPRRK